MFCTSFVAFFFFLKQYYFTQCWFVPTCLGKGSGEMWFLEVNSKRQEEEKHARSPYGEAANLPWWLQGMDTIPSTRSRFLMLRPFADAELGLGSPVPPALAWVGMMLPGVSGWALPTVDTRCVQGKAENVHSPYLNIPKKQSSPSLWPD